MHAIDVGHAEASNTVWHEEAAEGGASRDEARLDVQGGSGAHDTEHHPKTQPGGAAVSHQQGDAERPQDRPADAHVGEGAADVHQGAGSWQGHCSRGDRL